jgi:hypothetical protein
MTALRQAALTGVGAVRLPTLTVWDDLQNRKLVAIFPNGGR